MSHLSINQLSKIWASLLSQLVKNPPVMQETRFNSWVRKIHWRKDRLPIPVFLDLPCGSVGKESACNVEDLGLFPGLGRSPGEGKGYTLQYSGLENSMDYSQWGHKESDTTEQLSLHLSKFYKFHIISRTFILITFIHMI